MVDSPSPARVPVSWSSEMEERLDPAACRGLFEAFARMNNLDTMRKDIVSFSEPVPDGYKSLSTDHVWRLWKQAWYHAADTTLRGADYKLACFMGNNTLTESQRNVVKQCRAILAGTKTNKKEERRS